MTVFSALKRRSRFARPAGLFPAVVAAMGAAAILVGTSPAQAGRQEAKDDTAYTIKRVYKTGDADRYKITMKMNMDVGAMPVEIEETMVMRETTKEAKEDGTYTLVVDFPTATVTANGADVDIASMLPKFTVAMDKAGKADIKMEGGNDQLLGQMGDQLKQFANSATAFAPKKPVKVGDSWDVDVSNFSQQVKNLKGKSTFVSVETIKGFKVGKIRSVMDVVGDMGITMHTVATTYFVLASGKALSFTSQSDGDLPGGKMHMDMSLKMLDADAKTDEKEPAKADTIEKKP